MKRSKFLDFLIAPFFLLILIQFGFASISRLSHGPAQDFEVFYLSAQKVLKGENPYQKLGLDIVRNPPPALLILVPLTWLPIRQSEVIYFIFSLAAFVVASEVLFKCFKKYGKSEIFDHWQSQALYFALALRFFPFRHNLASGQVNSFVLLFIVLAFYFYLKKNEVLIALFFSLAIILKITPLFLLIIFLMKKKVKTVFLTIIFTFLFSLAVIVLSGSQIWLQYFKITNSFLDLNISTYYNQALTGFSSRLGINLGNLGGLGYLVVGIALSLPFVYGLFRNKREFFERKLMIWNIGLLLTLLLSPFAWQYHFTLAVFPLLTTSFLFLKQKNNIKPLFLVLLCYFLLAWNLKNPSLFNQVNLIGALITSHAFIGGFLLLIINYWLFYLPGRHIQK